MAPQNPILDDEAVRNSIIAHDPKMVLKSAAPVFGDGDLVDIHFDLNRSREVERLLDLVGTANQSGLLQSGNVTLSALALDLWGRDDEALVRRVRQHFLPWSPLNAKVGDGTIYTVSDQDVIQSRNRHGESSTIVQAEADLRRTRVTRTQEQAAKGLARKLARAKKISPDISEDLTAIAVGALQAMSQNALEAQTKLNNQK